MKWQTGNRCPDDKAERISNTRPKSPDRRSPYPVSYISSQKEKGLIELAIDIGTSKTAIYQRETGLVLSEPSVAAILQGKSATLKCAGSEAKKLIGKAPSNIKINFPLFEGLITLPFVASLMLEHFLLKITQNKLLKSKVEALITTPCGISALDKEIFENVALDAGIKKAFIIESPHVSALNLNCSLKSPILIVDIGGGKTDISVVSEEGIIKGCSLGIGGNNMDTGLIDFISEEYRFKMGLLTAERIRIQIGTLHENDNSSITVNGKDVIKEIPCSMEISSKSIKPIISYYYGKIAEVIKSLINDLDKTTLNAISQSGAYFIGGASTISGLKEFFGDYLKMRVTVLEEPAYTTVKGAGKLLNDKKLLKSILER